MKAHFKNIIGICFLLILSISACTKYEGYYDFENKERVYDGSTLKYLQSKPGVFDSVLLALNRLPYLKEALENEEVTFFAPTNIAFQTAFNNLNLVRQNQSKPKHNINSLNIIELDSLMTKYVAIGKLTTDSTLYIDGLFVQTYNISHPMHAQRIKENASGLVSGGMELLYYSDTKGNSFQSQWVRASSQAVNIITTNGVVHVLGGRHEFGFGEFLTKMND